MEKEIVINEWNYNEFFKYVIKQIKSINPKEYQKIKEIPWEDRKDYAKSLTEKVKKINKVMGIESNLIMIENISPDKNNFEIGISYYTLNKNKYNQILKKERNEKLKYLQ